MQMQASCAARHGAGVLLLGPPGSGKSDLLLRLLDIGFTLVADDRVDIVDGWAQPPASLAGLLEVRGLGIVRLPYLAPVRLTLAAELGRWPERLPLPARHAVLDLPLLAVDALQNSAPQRIALALECALGRVPQLAGAFGA
jgi:HPr kinase/phosphorylase